MGSTEEESELSEKVCGIWKPMARINMVMNSIKDDKKELLEILGSRLSEELDGSLRMPK